jgi:prepilin-type N-terminal cleavage/methylation domain-containing protein
MSRTFLLPLRGQAAAARGALSRAGRRGFTLIELLVVMTVIAILASMVLAGLYSANESAKLAKTKATIAKLHGQILERWDSYRTRRLPLILGESNPNETTQQFAARRLKALWTLQRLEMPDDYSEIATDFAGIPTKFDPITVDASFSALRGNALQQAYVNAGKNAYDDLVAGGRTPTEAKTLLTEQNASAECLYLMFALGMNADEEVRVLESELGDTDHDGIPEIIDGWGRPIRWIRWAPGYVHNVLTPGMRADSDFQRADPPGAPVPQSFQPDPFDPRGVCRPDSPIVALVPPGNPTVDGRKSWGFKLVPLVFSAGPDGEYSISGLRAAEGPPPNYDAAVAWNPYSYHPAGNPPPDGLWRGAPVRGLEGGGHMDNITNHRLGTR